MQDTSSRIQYYLQLFSFSRDEVHKSHKAIQVQFLVDTGAQVSILNNATFKEIQQMHPEIKIQPTNVRLRAAESSVMNILGTATITFHYDLTGQKPIKHEFFISGDDRIKRNLLGMDLMQKEGACLDLQNSLANLRRTSRQDYLPIFQFC